MQEKQTRQQTFDRIPAEMRNMRHWVCWQRKPDPKSHSGVSKLPINPKTGGQAQSNNPDTWSDFETACRAAIDRGLAGIGFMFQGSGLFGVDVDDRPLDAPEVQEILAGLPSYSERSQSGRGIHIICKGSLPGKDFNNRTEGIEMYSGKRFFVMTGDACTDCSVLADCSEAVKPFYARYQTHKKQPAQAETARPSKAAPTLELDAQQIIDKAQRARNGQKFAALYAGDISGYNSQSEADIAFCNLLAFWTGRNAALMDEIYRNSGLMREKWDRATAGSTYGAITIQQAIADCTQAYRERKPIEPAEAFAVNIGHSAADPLDWNDEIRAEQPAGTLDHDNGEQLGAATVQAPASDGEQTEPGAAPQPQQTLPGYFYYTKQDELRVDPTKLLMYIRKREYYFFVANGAMEGVRRYWYNKRRGVYELVSDEQIKSKIRAYIDQHEPTAARSRDINEVFNLLCLDDCRKSDEVLDSDEALINFRNGFYNLNTGEMIPHSPGIYSTIQLDIDYQPGRSYTLADAPALAHYLNDLTEGDTDAQRLLLEYMGACLSNVSGYRYKKALFLVGAPDAGKSQYVLLISKLLGKQNCASVRFQNLDERFQSSAIYGKRLVCDADMPYGRAKCNSYFMNYTGGDIVQIEYKGLNHFSTVYRGFLLFASNTMPKWGGNTSEASYNRMMILECNNTIPEERRDKALLEKMYSERNVIVSLAITALIRTIQRGYKFTHPQKLDSALVRMRTGNSPAIAFYEECCTIWPDAGTNIKHCIRRSDMHRVFKQWCGDNTDNDRYTCSNQQFIKDIAQLLGKDPANLIRVKDGTRYYLFTLRQDTAEEYHVFGSVV